MTTVLANPSTTYGMYQSNIYKTPTDLNIPTAATAPIPFTDNDEISDSSIATTFLTGQVRMNYTGLYAVRALVAINQPVATGTMHYEVYMQFNAASSLNGRKLATRKLTVQPDFDTVGWCTLSYTGPFIVNDGISIIIINSANGALLLDSVETQLFVIRLK